MSPVPSGPKVVAVGGGHGTAVTLKALRRYAAQITAVVSVADDGGSSGRLRQQLDVVALGDLRKCLVALADPSSVLARAFEHRFGDAGSSPATPWATSCWPGWWTPPGTWSPASTTRPSCWGRAAGCSRPPPRR